ncbi:MULTISPECIES: DUF3122 domain-containing protein [Nostocales]|jgi:hypothetical protein|uniref:DUF3122 domain-containing protein n=2 Tax=Aphanizomenonaceae TaxID=1892259 RepID=A0ACC7S4B5_DOLFA|nr:MULTISPECIES: DUF3122 domain-containing protein [Nostocales]MBO1069440.1 DUF3122 domain-containing protein [Dolichospermum sp. DEX189]MCX5980610.1 DUF3122 domain-containing protein [Nostocales cyanobacterium LacPavin_0920_SED1_MAG_38_18]ALB42591.1 hypothetical protein AA650_20935 [Anabaena sp. WA102]MBD2280670.1 DUF3122 domain-containing protein [Aphanizomenon flos-aquae FACHB-1040]MBO1064517.1 DUF3122 domain-containing protein [Anabaena sp. 54]
MLPHIQQIFKRILLVGILTTFIFLGLANLSSGKVIAAVTQIGNPPEEIIYRSQVKLDDQSGKVWQVVLFKQVYSDQPSNINLRLVGFPSVGELIHPQPLKITSTTGKVWNAADVFLEEAPAPTVGQYDLTEILPQLPPESLTLSIPLPSTNFINIAVPIHVVKEWQSLISTEN